MPVDAVVGCVSVVRGISHGCAGGGLKGLVADLRSQGIGAKDLVDVLADLPRCEDGVDALYRLVRRRRRCT